MNAQSAAPKSRVIVAVGPAAANPLAIRTAARLASAAGAELAALFIEDINLLRLADLPIAYEISATSNSPRRLAAADLERAFKSQAEELRRTLTEAASTLQIDLTFETARGRPVHVLLEASAQRDLVVFASAAVRTLTHASAATVLRDALQPAYSRAERRRSQPVAAVLQSAASAQRTLAAAHRLARASAADLVLLLAGHGAAGAELSAAVDAWLGKHDAVARVTSLPDLTPATVAEFIANEEPLALFWPGDGEPEIATEVDALLATIDCPLIVVR